MFWMALTLLQTKNRACGLTTCKERQRQDGYLEKHKITTPKQPMIYEGSEGTEQTKTQTNKRRNRHRYKPLLDQAGDAKPHQNAPAISPTLISFKHKNTKHSGGNPLHPKQEYTTQEKKSNEGTRPTLVPVNAAPPLWVSPVHAVG